MTRVATAYVEIKPDLSAFGKGLDAEIKARLAGVGRGAADGIGREVSKVLGASTSKVKVDVDRNSLRRLTASIGEAGAAGLSSIKGAAESAFAGLAAAAGGAGGVISGALSGLASLGPVLRGAGIVLATLLLPAAIALAASLATAAAGAAALGVALAAALGPVALVGLAIITRVALIIKAVAASQKATTDASNTSSQALQAQRAATDQVAAAEQNLTTQLKAARQAQIDATEAVKDDKLARAQAKEGIVGARLTTRQAIKDLQDFRKQAGAAGAAYGAVFKKFTDVNVDTSGLKKALAAAGAATGTALNGDQELELEQKIHAVREAKLGEKAANDQLHDSNVKLSRDEQTQADFLEHGAAAYAPYVQAVEQLKQAQRGLATATASANAGVTKQRQAFAGLTPAERKFGTLLLSTGKALKSAFSPAVAASLGGISKAIAAGLKLLKDPKIAAALKGIGVAIGSVFSALAKEVSRPEIRDAFVKLAAGGAKLVKIFGTKVFIDLERILLRIAIAALPALLALMDKLGGSLDGLEKGSRNTKALQDAVDSVVGSFSKWLELVHQVGRVFLGVIRDASGAGDSLVVSLTDASRKFADFLNTDKGRKSVKQFFQDAVQFAQDLGDTLIAVVKRVREIVNFVHDHAKLIRDAAGAWAIYKGAALLAIAATKVAAFAAAFRPGGAVAARYGALAGGRYAVAFRGALIAGTVGLGIVIASAINKEFTDAINSLLGTKRTRKNGPTANGMSTVPGQGSQDLQGTIKSLAHKLGIPGFATGGFVGGRGGTDSQLIRATPDEFVVNPTGVRTAGAAALLDLNRGRKPIGAELHLTQHIYTDDSELAATKAARRAMQAYELALDREP